MHRDDPDGDPLTYSYSSSGGQVTGTGANATFDATGLQPGTYTVKCTVNDGRGGTADASGDVECRSHHRFISWRSDWPCTAFTSQRRSPPLRNPMGGLMASQAVTLETLATDFKQYLTYKPDAHLILGGHADVRGGKEYNQLLSERRVEQTKSYLIEKGIPADHIDTKAYGEEQNMTDAEVKSFSKTIQT